MSQFPHRNTSVNERNRQSEQVSKMVNFVTIDAAAVLIVIAIFYYWRKNQKSYHLPPGPKQNLIFGNLIELIYSTWIKGEYPCITVARWALQTGPICYLRFFRQRVVVISDAQVAHRLCVNQAEKFSERPTGLLLSRVLKDKGIVFNDGPSWKEHRTFITHEFRKYGFGKQLMEQRIQYVVDEYLHQIGKTNGQFHDPLQNIATAVYNIMWKVISGVQFEWGDPFLQKVIINLQTNLQAVELMGPHNYVTVLTALHLIWHNFYILSKITIMRLLYFKQLIGQFQKHQKESTDSEAEESMMLDYLVKMQDAKNSDKPTHFSEKQLLWLVSDLFIGGGETSIGTMRWILLFMAKYPEIQERVRHEITEAFGRESAPAYSQRTQTPYTEAFIYEVLRLGGVAPAMWHNTSEDATYEGYDIPKDTWVLLQYYAMNTNENHWEDAKTFKPERFLNEEGNFCKNDNLLAFSIGRRECPGRRLVETELFLYTVGILQKFRVALHEDDKNIDVTKGHFGFTYVPPVYRIQFVAL